MKPVDVGSLLDLGEWSGYQKLLVAFTALAIVVDGFDNQLLAISIPALMREWDVPRAAFAAVLAAGMVGMVVGGALGGLVGDRVGRRAALLASVAGFGVLTALASVADNISASFFFCLLAVYVGINWVPSMLAGAGFDVGVSSSGLAAFNLGGVAGALLGAVLMPRVGSRRTMLTMAAGAVAGAAAMSAVALATQSALVVLAMLAWTGGLINAVQTTMYALAAHIYPTGIRATGVGTAVAVGRMGGVLSTYAGSWALESGGASRLFVLLAVAMSVVFVALASVRRHITPTR